MTSCCSTSTIPDPVYLMQRKIEIQEEMKKIENSLIKYTYPKLTDDENKTLQFEKPKTANKKAWDDWNAFKEELQENAQRFPSKGNGTRVGILNRKMKLLIKEMEEICRWDPQKQVDITDLVIGQVETRIGNKWYYNGQIDLTKSPSEQLNQFLSMGSKHLHYTGKAKRPIINVQNDIVPEPKWFFSFSNKENNESLMKYNDYDEVDLLSKFIISKEYILNSPVRKYAVFEHHLEFLKYYHSLNADLHFYEVIMEGKTQKMKFDIDVALKDPELISFERKIITQYALEIIKMIMWAMMQIDPSINVYQFRLFSSCDYQKESYHLIVLRTLSCASMARNYYNLVCELIKEKFPENAYLTKFIDRAVYSSLQNFRLLDSCKIGTKRYKKLILIEYDNHIIPIIEREPERAALEIFEDSLVCFSSGYDPLIPLVDPEVIQARLSLEDVLINGQSVEEIAPDIFDAAKQYFVQLHLDFPFEYQDVNNNIIMLKRLHSSFCPLCNRIHELENPFLSLFRNKIYFNCRRADTGVKSYFLGIFPMKK